MFLSTSSQPRCKKQITAQCRGTWVNDIVRRPTLCTSQLGAKSKEKNASGFILFAWNELTLVDICWNRMCLFTVHSRQMATKLKLMVTWWLRVNLLVLELRDAYEAAALSWKINAHSFSHHSYNNLFSFIISTAPTLEGEWKGSRAECLQPAWAASEWVWRAGPEAAREIRDQDLHSATF